MVVSTLGTAGESNAYWYPSSLQGRSEVRQ